MRTRFIDLLANGSADGGSVGGGGRGGRSQGAAKGKKGAGKKAAKASGGAVAIGAAPTLASFKKLKIDEDGVAKVVPERIFSLAMHPAEDKTMVLAGDKWGVVGVWDKDSTQPEHAIVSDT